MNHKDTCINIQLSETSLRLFYISIVILDVVLLSAYLLLRSQLFGSLDAVKAQLDFRHENVAAVWYSGMVLLSTGVAALLCFHVDQNGDSSVRFKNVLRFGWLVIALAFAGFSFDEMGSIHERSDLIVSGASYTLGLPGWIGVLWPCMAIGVLYYVLFAWSYLSRSRVSLVMALVGGGLLISVPVQEFLEAKMRLGGQKRDTLLGVLEEGSEVVGATLILISFLEWAIRTSRIRTRIGCNSPDKNRWIQITISNQFFKLTYAAVVFSAMASIAMAWFLIPHLKDLHHRGNPSVWYPSIALLLAAVVAIVNFVLERRSQRSLSRYSFKWAWIVVSAVCLWFSVDFEAGVNRAIFASFVEQVSDFLLISGRAGEILLSAIIVSVCSVVVLTVASFRANGSSRWLFIFGVLSWAGIFAASSWEMKEALKIVTPTLFLLSFIESMKYLYFAATPKTSTQPLRIGFATEPQFRRPISKLAGG